MPYLYLTLAIAFEIAATSLLKLSQGFSKIIFGLLALVFYGLCFFFLSLSLKEIQLNIAYALWSGLGLLGTTVLSVFIWHEKVGLISLLGMVLVVAGLILLNLSQKLH